MKRNSLSLAIAAAVCLGSTSLAATSTPPNFIVILLDDAGWRDMGFTGNNFIETPNLDRLARAGVIFKNAYATHPFCAPSRQSMITGQWPARTAWTRRDELRNPEQRHAAPPFSPAGAPGWTRNCPEFTSIAEALKGAGYKTGHVGKWHFGIPGSGIEPETVGFDVNFGGSNTVGAVKDFFAPYEGLPGDVEAPADEYLTERLTDEAIAFIKANRDHPFFLQLWHYAPHTPIQAPAEVVAKYRKKRAESGDPSLNPTYAAMIDVVDQGVGRIVGTLEALGLADRTVILFTSDNGGVASLGSVPVTSMEPLRGHKGLTYEGGVRVPMFIYRPGTDAGGTTFESPVSIMDFYPTILDLAGVALPEGQPTDGTSLVSAWQDEPRQELAERPLFWHNITSGVEESGEVYQPVSAVRRGPLRLVHNFERPPELYNLEDDPGETRNLAEANPGILGELGKLLEAWWEDTGVARPTANPKFDPNYVIPRQLPPAEVPEDLREVRSWDFAAPHARWRPTRMVKTENTEGALRMASDGLYPEIATQDVRDLPPGVYYLEVTLRVPTSGRIRAAWSGGQEKGEIEFYPERDGQSHTLTAVFQSSEDLKRLQLAAPTHLHVTGHFDPQTQPDYVDIERIRLLTRPTETNADS